MGLAVRGTMVDLFLSGYKRATHIFEIQSIGGRKPTIDKKFAYMFHLINYEVRFCF